MRFNSLTFLIFAVAFFGLWPLLKRGRNTRWLYLTLASFFFYGWWDWRFLFLIIGSGLIDFYGGLAIHRWPRHKRLWLVTSIIGNVGSLAAFKYSAFLAENVSYLTGLLGLQLELQPHLPQMMLIVPVGISFYTFQSMSYTIDIYRGKLTPTNNVLHFFAYLSLFPQLVAGPIVRARHLMPQLLEAPEIDSDARYDALKCIIRGFFKKIVVADVLALHVNEAFGAASIEASALYWWVIMVLFAFQIYCDFSGYSDIAIGLGKWMGYNFPTNFDHPYISKSFREFWTRWHISLSTWFRDYVYIPLGGGRCSVARGHLHMWIVMIVSGLWHGAAWPFVIWGILHAAYLSLERLTAWPEHLQKLPGGKHLCVLIVWVMTLVGWTFFRAGTVVVEGDTTRIGRALRIVAQMFNISQFNAAAGLDLLKGNIGILVGIMVLRQLYFHLGYDQRPKASNPGIWYRRLEIVGYGAVIACCVYFRGPSANFIYFQF